MHTFHKTNTITTNGKNFILNRLVNNKDDPISYMILCEGKTMETSKNRRIYRKITKTSTNTINPSMEFQASFTNQEVENMGQISLTNKEDGTMFTHSVLDTPFSKLPDNITLNIIYTLHKKDVGIIIIISKKIMIWV